MSVSIRWLREDEAFIFRCDPCQITRRLGRTELLDLLGDAPLQNSPCGMNCGARDASSCRLADLAKRVNAAAILIWWSLSKLPRNAGPSERAFSC